MTEQAFTYNFAGLAAAHADIIAAARGLNQTHAEVVDLMQRLQKSWTEGDAAAAWHAYQYEWNTIFADLNSELISLGAALDQCRQNAHNAELANREMWPD